MWSKEKKTHQPYSEGSLSWTARVRCDRFLFHDTVKLKERDRGRSTEWENEPVSLEDEKEKYAKVKWQIKTVRVHMEDVSPKLQTERGHN